MTPSLLDQTHDPARQSWLASAAPGRSPFPIQNLPFGVFRRRGSVDAGIGVRIGDQVLDLRALHRELMAAPQPVADALAASTLNALMGLPDTERRQLRMRLSSLLSAGGADEGIRRRRLEQAMVSVDAVEMCLPAAIGSFVDFYACRNHALTAGTVLRRGEPAPLPTNWTWMPLGYHGRAASVQVSGQPVRRPSGQRRPDRASPPSFGLSRELDYEVEIGVLVGPGCAAGSRVPIGDAPRHAFGYVLVNDWSARDVQTWEGGPLGPFLSKSFATSVSPWVVTSEALAPFRAPAQDRPAGDPAPLPYLDDAGDREWGGLDIAVSAHLRTARMRAAGQPAQRVSEASARELSWTMGQMIAHASSNGSGLAAGDLLASGTISGSADGTRGCLLEASQRGRVPLAIGDEMRGFLEDGDEVTLTATCDRDGFVPIGFGVCAAVVMPGEE